MPKGVCVDVLKDFAEFVKTTYQKNVQVNYLSRESDFGLFLNNVKASPNVIGVSNTTITEERKNEMKFSPYFLKTPLVVLSNKSASNVATLKEMANAGLTGLVEKGTSYAEFLEKVKEEELPKLRIEYASSTAVVVQQLSASAKYFTVMDLTEYLGEAKSNPNIKRQAINLRYNVELGFIMSKKSDWDVLFSEFLTDTYRESVTYKKAVVTYLGANFMAMVR